MSRLDSLKRQVLVNLGNRFVVFGPELGLPEPLLFNPTDSPIFPRVSNESEIAKARIVETLQISGMTRRNIVSAGHLGDVEFADSSGNLVLIDVKVRESDPKQKDIELQDERLKRAISERTNLAVWYFNIERLKLTVVRHANDGLRLDVLEPLNVWEATADGIFERQRVVDEVDDWAHRIDKLYFDVSRWLQEREGLRFEQMRNVVMSEEMMQEFAVPDRELPVLDVLSGDEVVVSFVPRGLWIIGAWGRVDVITKKGTSILVAKKVGTDYEWWIAPANDRRALQRFDEATASDILGVQ